MVRRVVAVLLVAAVFGGCVRHYGGPTRVLKPEGETVTLSPAKGLSVTGEFLGLRGDQLVVRSGGRLVEVTLPPDADVEVEGYPTVEVGERDKLRLYARYPQGLSDELWGELLRQLGQTSFDPVPAR